MHEGGKVGDIFLEFDIWCLKVDTIQHADHHVVGKTHVCCRSKCTRFLLEIRDLPTVSLIKINISKKIYPQPFPGGFDKFKGTVCPLLFNLRWFLAHSGGGLTTEEGG